jgi:hypothetical protein
MKYLLPSGPIFPALGNHDSNPEDIDSPHSLPGVLGQQQSWNYDHVAGLWQQNGWISSEGASEARMHYAAYSINHPSELCYILINGLCDSVADHSYSPSGLGCFQCADLCQSTPNCESSPSIPTSGESLHSLNLVIIPEIVIFSRHVSEKSRMSKLNFYYFVVCASLQSCVNTTK